MNDNQIPSRPLGRTGEEISILGLGGTHIGSGGLSDAGRRTHGFPTSEEMAA